MSDPGLGGGPLGLLFWMLSDPARRGSCPAGGSGAPLDAAGWEAFADLAIHRHRVHPWIAHRLGDLPAPPPPGPAGRIAAAARENALAALAQKGATARIGAALAARGIPMRVLKGWPVAEALHGAAALRHAKDLDLLVRPADREAAAEALRGLGFRGALPGGTAEQGRDASFAEPGTGLEVELHWRAFWRREIPGLEAGGTDGAPGLPPAAMLAHLALHGAETAFARLKWLHDIALALAVLPPAEIAAALELGRRAGAGRAVALAFRLAHRLLAAPLPVILPPEGWRDRLLARLALRAIASRGSAHASAGDRLRHIAARALAGDGWGDALGEFRREAALRLARPARRG